MATIEDAAELAGVSIAIVSRVINQTAWVEPVTRERVKKVIRGLNHHRNAAAIALVEHSDDMLGLLIGNLVDPFFARLARGAEKISCQQQSRLMVCSGGHDEGVEKLGLDLLINQGCEAIVVHVSKLPEKELLWYAAHFPAMVVTNRYIAGMASRRARLENGQAAKTTTLHLLERGHRCIACVTSDLPIVDHREQLEGYRRASTEYGIAPDRDWMVSVPSDEEGSERAMHQLFNCGTPFTTAATFNDVMVVGIMHIPHQRGIALPQRPPIVGFDDVVMACYLCPTFIAMHYPAERMAHYASQLAIQFFKGTTQCPGVNSFTADPVTRDPVPPPSL